MDFILCIIASAEITFVCYRLGGAVVTRSPLTATTQVRLWCSVFFSTLQPLLAPRFDSGVRCFFPPFSHFWHPGLTLVFGVFFHPLATSGVQSYFPPFSHFWCSELFSTLQPLLVFGVFFHPLATSGVRSYFPPLSHFWCSEFFSTLQPLLVFGDFFHPLATSGVRSFFPPLEGL